MLDGWDQTADKGQVFIFSQPTLHYCSYLKLSLIFFVKPVNVYHTVCKVAVGLKRTIDVEKH